ncbi:tyrosine-type recombinase/integrase [Glycomyces dulcitolivorans]|uniref:tyrosine-type recombinase/integrase n=1 Tax=Glycomyces dulcitolivorans TaxID=2200759 RepID=UPI000DD2DF10|nr:site-specific integrase [Glycomyces dulcitolivorans]
MGYCAKRSTKHGRRRYTAVYWDVDGNRRSAGTFDTKKEATEEWRRAEAKVKEGRGHHLVRGRISFRDYVEQHWLPNLTVQFKTREIYTYQVYAHFMDYFGEWRMLDIRAADVKTWLTERRAAGVSAANCKRLKTVLGTIFYSALQDEVVPANPCQFIKTEKVPKKALKIITPEQFDVFYCAINGDMWKLLVEVAIESGLRWGELTELRAKDFDLGQSLITVSRAVVQLNPKFHPEGGRFLVKPPKDHEQRLVKIRTAVAKKIDAHIQLHGLGPDDLLFWYFPPEPLQPEPIELPPGLGRTEPNAKGRTYRHGTTSAYSAGKCRCEHCRKAAAMYRRKRRAGGKDQPRPRRRWDTDGHIPGRWFRDNVIKPALIAAGLPVDIRMHLLRHAHASWLVNGGTSLVDVRDRLGHASIQTTERYLHTIDDYGEAALAALDKVRGLDHPDAPTLVRYLEGAPVQDKELKEVSSKVLFEYLAAFQAEINRRLVQNETGAGA